MCNIFNIEFIPYYGSWFLKKYGAKIRRCREHLEKRLRILGTLLMWAQWKDFRELERLGYVSVIL